MSYNRVWYSKEERDRVESAALESWKAVIDLDRQLYVMTAQIQWLSKELEELKRKREQAMDRKAKIDNKIDEMYR